MRFALDAAQFPASRRRRAWRDLMCETYVNLDNDYADDDFRSEISGHLLDDGMLTHVTASSRHHVERSPTLIKRDGRDVLFFGFVASGRIVMEQGGREATLEAGCMAFNDSTRPFRTFFSENVELDWVCVPKKAFEDRARGFEDLTAVTFHPTTPIQTIASDFISGLRPVLDRGMPDGDAQSLLNQGLDLLAMTMAGASSCIPMGSVAAALRTTELRRLKASVDDRLHCADLKLPGAASALGMSPRRIDALFALEGTAFDAYLLARRLDGCRAFLASATRLSPSPDDVATLWGFVDLGLFRRAFEARFGMSPYDIVAKPATPSPREASGP